MDSNNVHTQKLVLFYSLSLGGVNNNCPPAGKLLSRLCLRYALLCYLKIYLVLGLKKKKLQGIGYCPAGLLWVDCTSFVVSALIAS